MSDHKPNNPQNGEDINALYDLLNRLEKRDEVRRYQEFTNPRPIELIAAEEEKEQKRPIPARFQPNNLSEIDSGVLLLTDTDEFAEEEPVTPPAVVEKPTRIEQDEALPERPHTRRNPFKALWVGFCGNLPHKEDSTGTKVRKYGFLTSLLVMLLAIVYLVVDLVIIPAQNEKLKQELIEMYHPEKSQTVITKEEAEQGNYPRDMLASFVDLYNRNNEVRGWITYKSDFLNIEYPIVYSGDNEKYLRTDFDGDKNRNGTLFFDGRNCVDSATDKNRALIVYGHNMASGQMFAGLNKLLGNVNNARAAATFTMSTLFREDYYKVFAVVLIDESDNNERSYNMWRTEFFNDTDFENHIEEIRKRSLFDYEKAVDVNANDQILVLSTCTGKSSAHVKDGRLLVVARRVRDGEQPTVKTSAIVKNNDVIMPYYWYINQKKTPHSYYLNNDLDNETESTSAQSSQGGTMYTGFLPQPSTSTTVGSSTVGTESTESTVSTTNPGSSSSTSVPTKPSTSTNTSTSTSTSTPTKPTMPTECTHEYISRVLKEPTCTDYGLTKYTCEKCGYSYTENTMPIAHSFSGKCGSKCQNCDTRLQHKWNSGEVLQKPTCDKPGNILYTCTVCGDEHYDRSKHNAGDSDPVHIRKDPCVESGEAHYLCQDCGELFLKDMFPIGYHDDHNGDNQCDGCGEHIDE